MDISVFTIHPNHIKIPKKINNISYSFLDNIYDINFQPYYDLLNTFEDFRIKNIYHFIYLRSILIHNKFNSIPILKKNMISFNDDIIQYINKDKIKAIIIMNGIQQYFTPIKDQPHQTQLSNS